MYNNTIQYFGIIIIITTKQHFDLGNSPEANLSNIE